MAIDEKRIHGFLTTIGAASEDLFCTIHRVEDARLVTLFSSHPLGEQLGTWQSVHDGIVGSAALSVETVSVGDVQADPRYVPLYSAITSELAIPIVDGGRCMAVVNFESTRPKAFEGNDFARFHIVAEQLRGYFLPATHEKYDALLVPEAALCQLQKRKNAQLTCDEISETLLRELARDPSAMYQLSPRRFEELVARVLSDLGLKVTLTPPIKDGGFDMFAELVTPVGTVLTLVECKRYAPHHPVSVEIVRNLYGVVHLTGATRGLIATTSRFTSDARALQDAVKYRLSLNDYQDLAAWLRRYEVDHQ
jgi:HJR/Mrr/RecB family endonuclease